jgi:alpha-beta hydrolase superfamily lysophospholipase
VAGLTGRIWRFGQLGAVAAVTGLAALIAARSYLRETREFFPERRLGEMSAASAGLPGLETVAFRDPAGAMLRGWYAPSVNRAGVVLLHGAGGDRASQLPEARHLASRGFGVLLFDWPGQGESDGEIHWSEGEARALVAAIDFLATRADLDGARLGALGFSLGGAVLARVAPAESRLQAVVFAGTPSNQMTQIQWEYGQWGPLSWAPALWAVQRRGVPVHENQPQDHIGGIAPRPVLIVSGTEDQTVPLSQARDLFAAAGDPKELLLVNSAGHGGFDQAPGSTYLNRISSFFEGALLGERP